MALVEVNTDRLSSHSALIDRHGRRMRKLRVSLLEACNFRCFYCMPEKIYFASQRQALSPAELKRICGALVEAGITQIRITGGEPTLRRDFREAVSALAELPLEKLGMTSNGFYLAPQLEFLRAQGCIWLNISLDSLQESNFNRITRSKGFATVMRTIEQAWELGFQLKLNTVIMRGQNDHELVDFVRFSESTGIPVRFLELMKIGQAQSFQAEAFVSADEMLARLQRDFVLQPVAVEKDSTAFVFSTAKGAQVGFIASESKPFCGHCSRLRLSYDGKLRACLMLNRGQSLRHLDTTELLAVARQVVAWKPYERLESVDQNMHAIGG